MPPQEIEALELQARELVAKAAIAKAQADLEEAAIKRSEARHECYSCGAPLGCPPRYGCRRTGSHW